MGDVPGIISAVDIINKGIATVESITILSGPSDYNGLTDATKNELSIAKSFSVIPYVEYSTGFRFIAEMYFYRGDFEKDPAATLAAIWDRFQKKDITTSIFISSQIDSINDANLPETLQTINQSKQQPVINYIKIKNGQDSVVNNDYSSEALCDAAVDKADLSCNIVEVDSEHSQYYRTQETYTEAFQTLAPIVSEQVQKEQGIYAMKLYAATHSDNLSPLALK
jgi:hypothetical protein